MNARLFILATAMFVLVAGGVFIAMRTVPVPHHTIEKVFSNDRFFK